MKWMAHLNSGPRDDIYVPVDDEVLWVMRLEEPLSVVSLNDMPARPLPIVKGTYELRVDGLGQPVPHNLAGAVEFDWKGWIRD